jgi:hypothetical protein
VGHSLAVRGILFRRGVDHTLFVSRSMIEQYCVLGERLRGIIGCKLRIIISHFFQKEVSGGRIPPLPVWLKSNNRKKWLVPIIMQRCP